MFGQVLPFPARSFQRLHRRAGRDACAVRKGSKSLHTSTAVEAIPAPSSPLPCCQVGLGMVLRVWKDFPASLSAVVAQAAA